MTTSLGTCVTVKPVAEELAILSLGDGISLMTAETGGPVNYAAVERESVDHGRTLPKQLVVIQRLLTVLMGGSRGKIKTDDLCDYDSSRKSVPDTN